MIAILLVLVGVMLTVLGLQLVRRQQPTDGSPALTDLRRTLEAMERDYRLRVATEELTRETPALRQFARPDE